MQVAGPLLSEASMPRALFLTLVLATTLAYPCLATQRRMLTGALTFAPLLDRWLGPQPWAELRTPPFRYAVMPASTLTAPPGAALVPAAAVVGGGASGDDAGAGVSPRPQPAVVSRVTSPASTMGFLFRNLVIFMRMLL